MRVYKEEIPEITRYIGTYVGSKLEDHESTFDTVLENIGNYKVITPDLQVLEIGVGLGWFLIYCNRKGIKCRGIEISPQLVSSAREMACKYGVEPEILLGNIEDCDIGVAENDIIIAHSVFEHVEDWKRGIRNVYSALKPGGVFYFVSTNKFSFRSWEYNFPLYGWLPDRWRYGLRRWRQGEQIMKLGIDFNQFTHPRLRRYFKEVGFSRIVDIVDAKDVSRIRSSNPIKRLGLVAAKSSKLLKHFMLMFAPCTTFICIK
jgi:SAM-dependent methyltransferase